MSDWMGIKIEHHSRNVAQTYSSQSLLSNILGGLESDMHGINLILAFGLSEYGVSTQRVNGAR